VESLTQAFRLGECPKKEKKYWNGGTYSVEQPSEKYNQFDKD
jgi:hypothetical protein